MKGLLPPSEETVLDPATRFLTVPWRRLPLVHLHLHLDGGADLDPPGREGTASLTAELLATGAGERDRAAFARALDEAGANLDIRPGRRKTLLSLDLPSSALATGTALLADVLARPRLERDEFSKIRRRAQQDWVMLRENDPGALAALAGRAWLYGPEHPDGRLEEGEDRSLARIRCPDTALLHRRLVQSPKRWAIAVGDADEEDLAAVGRTLLAALDGARPPLPPPAPAAPGPTPILLLDRPGSTQAYLWLGHACAPTLRAEDPVALELARSTFGGHFTSLLNRRLRTELGLTYGAHCALRRTPAGGTVAIATYTGRERCAAALAAVLDLLDAFAERGPSASDLEATRRYLAGQHAFGFETPGQLAHRLEAIVEGLWSRSDDEDYEERLAGISVHDLSQIARTHFPLRDRFRLCVVGDAAALRPQLERFGAVTIHVPGASGLLPTTKRKRRTAPEGP
jgi:zinc protease